VTPKRTCAERRIGTPPRRPKPAPQDSQNAELAARRSKPYRTLRSSRTSTAKADAHASDRRCIAGDDRGHHSLYTVCRPVHPNQHTDREGLVTGSSRSGSTADPPPRQCLERCRTTPEGVTRRSVRFTEAAIPVTAVQAHPSQAACVSEDTYAIHDSDIAPGTRGARSSRTARPPKRPYRIDRIASRLRGPPSRSRRRQRALPSARTDTGHAGRRARRVSIRTKTDQAAPEPTGRSRTTSPMGFVAFRRKQRR
jgi:hypothetical protein